MAAEGDLGVEMAAAGSEDELQDSWKLQVDWRGGVREEEGEGEGEQRKPSAAKTLVDIFVNCTWNCGTVMLIAGVLCSSTTALIVKLLHDRVPLFQLIAVQSWVSCLVLMAWGRLFNVTQLGPWSVWAWLAPGGLSGAISISLVYASLYLIPLGQTAILFSSYPAWIAGVSCLLRLEPTNCMIMWGFTICLFGTALLSHPPTMIGGFYDWDIARIGGISMGVGGAVFASASFLFLSRIGTDVPVSTVAFWIQLCALFISLLPMFTRFPSKMVWKLEAKYIFLLGALSIGFLSSQTFVSRGLQIVAPSKGAIILTTQMVLACTWGILLLQESLTVGDILGMLFTAFGVLLVSKGNEVMESLKELAMEDVARWSWERLATALSTRYTRLNQVELSPSERFAMVYG